MSRTQLKEKQMKKPMYLCQSIYNGETGQVENCTCGKCQNTLKALTTQSTEKDWEKEGQALMDRLNMFDLEILNSIVFHKVQKALADQREEDIERLSNFLLKPTISEGIDTHSMDAIFEFLHYLKDSLRNSNTNEVHNTK